MPIRRPKIKTPKYNPFDHALFIFFVILFILSIIGIAVYITTPTGDLRTKAQSRQDITGKTWDFRFGKEFWQGANIKSITAQNGQLIINVGNLEGIDNPKSRPLIYNNKVNTPLTTVNKFFKIKMSVGERPQQPANQPLPPLQFIFKVTYRLLNGQNKSLLLKGAEDGQYRSYRLRIPEIENIIIRDLSLVFTSGVRPFDLIKIDTIQLIGN